MARAYADGGARRASREPPSSRDDRVLEINRATEGWVLQTEQGPINAEHVVNAAGMWGRKDLPSHGWRGPSGYDLHHYLVTEDVPGSPAIDWAMPAVTDLEGLAHHLQREQNGAVLSG
jgi:dimethylglycine dehydrogenase